jgi:chemotaxis protein MotB
MARRRQAGGGGGDENRWLATYGDAVTLLMAFFVMLYAISQVDEQKFQLLVSGLAAPFDNTSDIQGLLEEGDGIVGPGRQTPLANPQTEGLELIPEGAPLPGMESSGTGSQDTAPIIDSPDEMAGVREALIEVLEAGGLDAERSLRSDVRGLVVALATDDLLFSSGSPRLHPDGETIIRSMTPVLSRFGNELLIEGHTDSVPLNQDGYTNWNLSSDRALAVLRILEGAGIDQTRLSATGYGEFSPIADNTTERGRQANRRVELIIVAGVSPLSSGPTP